MDIEVDDDVEEDDLGSTDDEQEENMVGWNQCCKWLWNSFLSVN